MTGSGKAGRWEGGLPAGDTPFSLPPHLGLPQAFSSSRLRALSPAGANLAQPCPPPTASSPGSPAHRLLRSSSKTWGLGATTHGTLVLSHPRWLPTATPPAPVCSQLLLGTERCGTPAGACPEFSREPLTSPARGCCGLTSRLSEQRLSQGQGLWAKKPRAGLIHTHGSHSPGGHLSPLPTPTPRPTHLCPVPPHQHLTTPRVPALDGLPDRGLSQGARATFPRAKWSRPSSVPSRSTMRSP